LSHKGKRPVKHRVLRAFENQAQFSDTSFARFQRFIFATAQSANVQREFFLPPNLSRFSKTDCVLS